MTQVNMTQYFHQVYSTGFINKFCFCKCISTDEQMDQLKAHFTMLYSNCSLYIFKADLESVAGKMISYKNTNKYDRFSLVLTQNQSSWTFAVGVLQHALTHPIHTSQTSLYTLNMLYKSWSVRDSAGLVDMEFFLDTLVTFMNCPVSWNKGHTLKTYIYFLLYMDMWARLS